MNITRTVIFLICLSPFSSHAQSAGEPEKGWSVGIGVASRGAVYEGESGRSIPFPLIGYEGERFYLQGTSVGYRLIQNDSFTLKAHVSASFNSIAADDFGKKELAARGINRNLLEDRDIGADAGMTASWNTAGGTFEADIRADITNTSDGYQASLDYGFPFSIGNATVTPGVGVTLYSSDLANYYYGTLPEEIKRGVVDYKPGRATIPHTGVTAILPFASKWTFISSANIEFLPSEITDSPLVEKDSDVLPSLFLGVSRSF
jgi:MipA family protein